MLTGEDFFKDKSDDFSSSNSTQSMGIPIGDRVETIERVFNEVLGRKPSSRELAYYKYGVLKEEGIRSKLVKSQEHKDIVENALKLPGVQDELKSVRLSEKKLQQRVDDINQEILTSKRLLEEKNNLINDLRERVNNPYDIPNQLERFQEGFDVYTSRESSKKYTKIESQGFKEKLIDFIERLF